MTPLIGLGMTRFYFQLYNSVGLVPDQQGQMLADLDEARQQAIASIRSIVGEEATGASWTWEGELRS